MEALIIALNGNEAKIGQKLQKMVEKKEYDSLPKILNKIKVPKGCTLGLQCLNYDECCGMGDESHLKITLPDGKVLLDTDNGFWKFISCEASSAGAWQMYLLYNLWHYLPLFWHANYERRWYIYTDEQLKKCVKLNDEDHGEPLEGFDPDKYDISPLIWEEDGTYHVSACYWTNFGGLIREEFKIAVGEKAHVYSRPVSHRTLYRYECGICY